MSHMRVEPSRAGIPSGDRPARRVQDVSGEGGGGAQERDTPPSESAQETCLTPFSEAANLLGMGGGMSEHMETSEPDGGVVAVGAGWWRSSWRSWWGAFRGRDRGRWR
jgi:hypothetical protein